MLRGAQAVGEARQPVGRARRVRDRRVDVGDEEVEAVLVALRVAGGQHREPGRRRATARRGRGGRSSTASRRPTHSDSASSWSKASASSAASTSSQRRFLRPAEIWLMTTEPSAPPSVSNCSDDRVLGGRPRARAPSPLAAGEGLAARRRGARGSRSACARDSRAMRWPVTNSARSHQCEPMSANARDAPPSSASTRQLSSSGSSSQSCR